MGIFYFKNIETGKKYYCGNDFSFKEKDKLSDSFNKLFNPYSDCKIAITEDDELLLIDRDNEIIYLPLSYELFYEV